LKLFPTGQQSQDTNLVKKDINQNEEPCEQIDLIDAKVWFLNKFNKKFKQLRPAIPNILNHWKPRKSTST
jgi:hypothetical protein